MEKEDEEEEEANSKEHSEGLLLRVEFNSDAQGGGGDFNLDRNPQP